MDALDLLRAGYLARAADARHLELRRQYHEFRRIERLERALMAARRRGGLATLAPRGSNTGAAIGATTGSTAGMKMHEPQVTTAGGKS